VHHVGAARVEAYTFAEPGESSADLDAARIVCTHLGVKHIVVSPTRQQLQQFYLQNGVYMVESFEPVLVRNATSYHFVCKAVHENGHKVCLTGEGADEDFGGYDYFKQISDQRTRDQTIWLSLSEVQRTYLQMADRASMFTTLEVRVPFLDSRFVNHCCRIPPSGRIQGNSDKVVLRRIFRDNLPESITNRKKVGMTEGAGFGKNLPNVGVYAEGVNQHYSNNPEAYQCDLAIARDFVSEYKLDLRNNEEIYNFSRFHEFGYTRSVGFNQRPQLNTALLPDKH